LHYDQVGSLRAITDSNHNIIKEITYDTFGNILSDSNEAFKVPFGFAGGLQDNDTGLVRFGYRDYDPFTGKWTAKDPIGFEGGDSNLYGYVLGDPVNFVDPEGLILIAAPFIPALVELAGYAGLGAATTYAVSEAYSNNGSASLAKGQPSINLPQKGTPNSTDRTRTRDGLPKQKRRYGSDGMAQQDIDYDHDNGHGSPHVHDWEGKDRLDGRVPIDQDGSLCFDDD